MSAEVVPAAPDVVLNDATVAERQHRTDKLRDLAHRRTVRSIAAPTNDVLVRKRLRELSHPITLFGERPQARRERLLSLLATQTADAKTLTAAPQQPLPAATAEAAYRTVGSEQLRAARLSITRFSSANAVARLQRLRAADDDTTNSHASDERFKSFRATASVVCSRRAVAAVRIAASASGVIGVASWSGECAIYNARTAVCTHKLVGHAAAATGIAFRNVTTAALHVATASMDGTAALWSVPAVSVSDGDDENALVTITPAATLRAHVGRCSRLAFHVSGEYLFSSGADCAVGMWDVNTAQSLLHQSGHAYPTYALSAHPDGGLLFSGDTGGVGHCWDVRIGRAAMSLIGHADAILSADFHPDGHVIATGSADNSIRCWDIRSRRCAYVIPAHLRPVTAVRWFGAGDALISVSHDKTIRAWNGHTLACITQIGQHERIIMSADASAEENIIVTSSFDRTWKCWTNDADDAMRDTTES